MRMSSHQRSSCNSTGNKHCRSKNIGWTPNTNEAFSRVKIDAQLKDQGWEITNTTAARSEVFLPDREKADYVLFDRHGHSLAVIEVKKAVGDQRSSAIRASCALS